MSIKVIDAGVAAAAKPATKLLSIGRAWVNNGVIGRLLELLSPNAAGVSKVMTMSDVEAGTMFKALAAAFIADGGNRKPVINITIDRDLPVAVTLSPLERVLLFPNVKRDGKKDADLRLSIELPADQANAVITAQRAKTPVQLPA